MLGLSDRVLGNLSVSVPYGYNHQELRRNFPDLRIFRESPETYELGKTRVRDQFGIVVSAYNAERAIADMLKEKKRGRVSSQLARDVIVSYLRKGKSDLPKLTKMCAALGVRDELQAYLDVLP